VGYPEDIGRFYMLETYDAYQWTSHGRFPTNTPGWWGGAHPFTLLDWSIVHNGEISSYDANRRFVEMYGYKCTLMTDTEVITYLFDLLIRRHGLSLTQAVDVVAAPFWREIELMGEEDRRKFEAIRAVYASALINGPFSIILGFQGGMLALNDRIKLRPLVAAEKGDTLYVASEEAAIRIICASPDRVWSPEGGEPVLGLLEGTR
jgi:glutamate synthase domain-containing protein 1